ncbi:MAG: transcriptional regulator [Bdellovibrionota bacterium]
MGTVREKIIEELKLQPTSAYGLAKVIKSTAKSIEAHLEHVAKSVGPAFKVTSAECRECGFKFNKRDRYTRPTKCPKCRNEDIFPPLFFIE